jgi:CHAT domain-containing protein/tetratricopeptide (TPR) repeat protein
MDGMDFIQELFATDNPAEQIRFLSRNLEMVNVPEAARRLKEQADHYLRANLQLSLETCQLLYDLAEKSGDPLPKALGLLAEANARAIGMGEYEAALSLYDQGAEIYKNLGREVEQASAQIGKIGTLMFLGRYQEAMEIGTWAGGVLEKSGSWLPLAKLTNNLAIINYHLGYDKNALLMFEKSQGYYQKAGKGGSSDWLGAEFNRAIVLRNLGDFEASISASNRAVAMFQEIEQPINAARAQQSLAQTYFVLGRNNEALKILDEVREAFLADGRIRDAALVELYITDILLQLRRFPKVLFNCSRIRETFSGLGTNLEFSLAIVDEALAYAGLKQYEAALASLAEARTLFIEQGNKTWAAYAELESAEIYIKHGQPGKALEIAQECMQKFTDQPLKQSQACLIAAAALFDTGCSEDAEDLLQKSMQDGKQIVPALSYATHHLRARIAKKQGNYSRALQEFEQAIRGLEQWRSRMMVEFRASFLEDKQSLYDDAITMCVESGKPEAAFSFAERAKSQSLIELLENRVSLRIMSLDPEDNELIQELVQLREERDRRYRRWESDSREEMRLRGNPENQQSLLILHQEVGELEEKITECWHKLLIRNADYARENSLWQVQAVNVNSYLDADTILVEYYFAHGNLYTFLVTKDSIEARYLPSSMEQVERLMELLWLNLKTVLKSPPDRRSELTKNGNRILRGLYQHLIQPLEKELDPFPKIIIVPHGMLHYLPFHALYDGYRYMIGKHMVTYLPAANLIKYAQSVPTDKKGLLSVGHSDRGRLPFVAEEARSVASLWGEKPLVEEHATRKNLLKTAQNYKALHIAAHGEFRSDSPLFSGLSLEDGWLTTLDVFDWKLNASLVVLSACETGLSAIGGGDEVLGLMRAFLYAGASTLVLSQWAVEDQAASLLMKRFYTSLSEGFEKGEALRAAQLSFIEGAMDTEPGSNEDFGHPYYWAPFILVGNSGPF